MTAKIIFVLIKNDHGHAYDWASGITGGSHSYTDFHALVRLSGFKTCELQDVDFDSESVYIFAPKNGYSDAAFQNRKRSCKLVLWSLERPGTEEVPYVDEIWVSDRFQHALANNPKFRYVPMGGHPELGGAPAYPKVWDFAHISYVVGDRIPKMQALMDRGLLLAPASYGQPRDYSLAHSRFGLCLHQTPHPIIEPLRYTLFSCWKLPLICEWSENFWPYSVWPFDIDHILSVDEHALTESAEANFQLLTDRLSFRNCVTQAVNEPNKEF